jgi:hypothetical protein
VFSEHILYSAALAVLTGMIFSRYSGRDPSWIIIVVAYAADIDYALQETQLWGWYDIPFHFHHGNFHNVLFLVLFSLLFAGVLRSFSIRFGDALLCSAIGISAHFFEDLLVFNPAYAFLWPFSDMIFGWGILDKTRDFFGIANTTVLITGLVLLAGAVLVRTVVEGKGWWRVFLQGGRSG